MSHKEPAFPRDHAADGHNGMTLRDYFAAKAMQTEMLSCRKRFDSGQIEADDWREVQEMVALYAYDMADEMMAARERA